MAGDDNDLIVAIAALAIAIAAFIVATLQIAQAIFASARGLPNCSKEVMGDWATSTEKIFLKKQLRLEVRFEAPVILLAPYENKRLPVKDAPSWLLEGDEDSCKKCRIKWTDVSGESRSQSGVEGDGDKLRDPVHTIDSELATWVLLIVAIQKMEKDSKDWEDKRLREKPGKIPKFSKPTLTVQMQSRKRSFDTNPAIKKPFATTTISHLVLLAAVLGLHWKLFNRDDDKYRAEGNGYTFTGSRVADFGLVFVFEKTGMPTFTERRLIPTSEVKELAFGRVPTLYRAKEDPHEDVEWQNPVKTSSGNKHLKLEILQLGSPEEIAETLTHIGCNASTTLYYQKSKHHSHLFPVTFELVGMLARVLHVKNRCFRFLPNPTVSPWDRESLSTYRLLEAFKELVGQHSQEIEKASESVAKVSSSSKSQIQKISNLAAQSQHLLGRIGDGVELTYKQMNHLHDAIGVADEMLTEGNSPSLSQGVVLDVLRRHLQEVLAAINNPKSGQEEEAMSFEDLLEVPLKLREQEFMKIYFMQILWRVVQAGTGSAEESVSRKVHKDTEKRRRASLGNGQFSTLGMTPSQPSPSSRNSMAASQNPDDISTSDPTGQSSQPENEVHEPDGATKPADDALEGGPSWTAIVAKDIEMERLKIWYTLVFRMICWLMLHDFDKRDVQVPDSDVMGSRQPVFIT